MTMIKKRPSAGDAGRWRWSGNQSPSPILTIPQTTVFGKWSAPPSDGLRRLDYGAWWATRRSFLLAQCEMIVAGRC